MSEELRSFSGLILPGEPEYVRKPHGTIIVGTNEAASTLSCVHCNSHWIVVKGSGIKRGWCTLCFGPTCGAVQCFNCVPFEKKLEMMERG